MCYTLLVIIVLLHLHNWWLLTSTVCTFYFYLPYIYLSPHSLSVISDMTEDIRYQTSDMTEDILNQYYCSSILYFEKSGLSPALVGQLQQIIRPISLRNQWPLNVAQLIVGRLRWCRLCGEIWTAGRCDIKWGGMLSSGMIPQFSADNRWWSEFMWSDPGVFNTVANTVGWAHFIYKFPLCPIVTMIKMSIRLLYLLLGNMLSIVDNVTKLRKRSQSFSEHLILWKSISEGLLLNI